MNRTNVELIKERIPIEELIGQYVKLEKAGKSFKAKCPFHNEKTASFFVSPDRGGYYCFGCGAKGDIFSFVEQFEGLDFRGALKILAEKAGVPLVADAKADGERDRLFQIMEAAAAFFEDRFEKAGDSAAAAREYVKSRGINDATRDEFRIGWAPEGWSNLYAHLKGKGWNDELIEKAGLAKKGDKGDFYDRFRGRVMFPITDSSGRAVAFSGRILPKLDDGKGAKYINSPDTPLYDKSSVLYGLDKAKAEIRRLNYSIMVEGQMDLVMSHQAGVRNTVAASGTALSDESVNREGVTNNLGLIRRLSPNVIIAFDSDAAGRKAALRAAGIALSLGMDVKIADITGGKDPADLVKEDIGKWKEVLRHAKPVIEFELGNVIRDEPDPRKAPRALRERVFPFIAAIESSTDRAYFVKMVSERANIAEQAVWEDVRTIEKKQKEEGSRAAGLEGDRKSQGSANLQPSRIDLVERRMFGLLDLMESAKWPKAAEYRGQIRKIAGDSYDARAARIQAILSDVLFEAESFFGAENERWDVHMQELISNFEQDLINEQLMQAMQELRLAEKAKDQAKVAELAKKCQELSMKKAEVARGRK